MYYKNKGNKDAKVILEGGGAANVMFDKIVWNECYFPVNIPDVATNIFKLGVTPDDLTRFIPNLPEEVKSHSLYAEYMQHFNSLCEYCNQLNRKK